MRLQCTRVNDWQGLDLNKLYNYTQVFKGDYNYQGTLQRRTSVLFVSISFVILMIISLAWLLFYYVQRFRFLHAKDLLEQELGRKVISNLQL